MKPESDVLFDLIIKLRFESAFGKRFFVCYNNYIRMELEDRSRNLRCNRAISAFFKIAALSLPLTAK